MENDDEKLNDQQKMEPLEGVSHVHWCIKGNGVNHYDQQCDKENREIQ